MARRSSARRERAASGALGQVLQPLRGGAQVECLIIVPRAAPFFLLNALLFQLGLLATAGHEFYPHMTVLVLLLRRGALMLPNFILIGAAEAGMMALY